VFYDTAYNTSYRIGLLKCIEIPILFKIGQQ
jgi:hypothetical protein